MDPELVKKLVEDSQTIFPFDITEGDTLLMVRELNTYLGGSVVKLAQVMFMVYCLGQSNGAVQTRNAGDQLSVHFLALVDAVSKKALPDESKA